MEHVIAYVTNGILTAMLWAHFFWPERERRQLSIRSMCILIFMEAVTFGGLRLIIAERESRRTRTIEELNRQFGEFDRLRKPAQGKSRNSPCDTASALC